MHFNPDKPIVVETDTSNYVSVSILSQHDENNVVRPIAFYFKITGQSNATRKYMKRNSLSSSESLKNEDPSWKECYTLSVSYQTIKTWSTRWVSNNSTEDKPDGRNTYPVLTASLPTALESKGENQLL